MVRICFMNISVNHIEKRVTVREPLHSAIHINDTRKRMAFGKTNNKASLARHYGTSANIDTSNDYDRQTAFRLLALNGARGFGK